MQYNIFWINPLGAKDCLKYLIFDLVFLTIGTIGHSSMAIMGRNFVFTGETLKQIGFQKIWSYRWFVKCFGMILAVKVKKCVKSVMKNPHLAKLEDTPSPRGRQLGLVKLMIFCPYMYSLYPCVTQIFSAF